MNDHRRAPSAARTKSARYAPGLPSRPAPGGRAGAPATRAPSSTSRTTADPAPMTTSAPMVISGRTEEPTHYRRLGPDGHVAGELRPARRGGAMPGSASPPSTDGAGISRRSARSASLASMPTTARAMTSRAFNAHARSAPEEGVWMNRRRLLRPGPRRRSVSLSALRAGRWPQGGGGVPNALSVQRRQHVVVADRAHAARSHAGLTAIEKALTTS